MVRDTEKNMALVLTAKREERRMIEIIRKILRKLGIRKERWFYVIHPANELYKYSRVAASTPREAIMEAIKQAIANWEDSDFSEFEVLSKQEFEANWGSISKILREQR